MAETGGRSSVTGEREPGAEARPDGSDGAERRADDGYGPERRADDGYAPEQRAADRRLGAEVTQRRADRSRPDDGRGAAPSFDREPYPAVYHAPYRTNLKRALRAYVLGHDRGIDAERKLELAERGDTAWDRAERFRGPPAEGEVDLASLSGASAGHPDSLEEDAPESLMRHTRFGVPIPERFSFHRGPDVWRDRKGLRERVSWPARGAPAREAPALEATPGERHQEADAPAPRREG